MIISRRMRSGFSADAISNACSPLVAKRTSYSVFRMLLMTWMLAGVSSTINMVCCRPGVFMCSSSFRHPPSGNCLPKGRMFWICRIQRERCEVSMILFINWFFLGWVPTCHSITTFRRHILLHQFFSPETHCRCFYYNGPWGVAGGFSQKEFFPYPLWY